MAPIELSQDGNMVCALIGPDLQAGIGGFGPTVPAALRDLARMIEREGFPIPGFHAQTTLQRGGGLHEVKKNDLAKDLPIIPHKAMQGVDCCGCIIVEVTGNDAELSCNECGAVLGVIRTEILKTLLDVIAERVPHIICPTCGHNNRFPGFDSIEIVRCQKCEAVIETKKPPEALQ